MRSSSEDYKAILITGAVLIALGLVFNEWTLARLISSDGMITSSAAKVIIWVLDIIFIAAGFVLLKYKAHVKAHDKEILFSVVAFVLFLFLLEGGLRAFYFIKGRNVNFSESIGWQSKENLLWKKNYAGYGEVLFTTTKYGFRVFGDPNTDKLKIFVLGDSFTQATTVNDGDAYYDYMQKNHDNIEIFAYGSGGFGSLQEYMIFDKYFDMIKPDLVIWQFCPNDFINNSQVLESLSLYNNNQNTRPYYDYKTGEISLLFPRKFVGWADKFVQHSYLLKMLSLRLGILSGDVSGSIENYLKMDDPLAIETIRTTSAIMELVRKRAGDIPIISFQTDNEQLVWSGDAFSDISNEHSISYIDNVPEILLEADAKGLLIYGPDGSHWSEVGHSIVGERVLNYLFENKLLTR